jgi:hypothetical protein
MKFLFVIIQAGIARGLKTGVTQQMMQSEDAIRPYVVAEADAFGFGGVAARNAAGARMLASMQSRSSIPDSHTAQMSSLELASVGTLAFTARSGGTSPAPRVRMQRGMEHDVDVAEQSDVAERTDSFLRIWAAYGPHSSGQLFAAWAFVVLLFVMFGVVEKMLATAKSTDRRHGMRKDCRPLSVDAFTHIKRVDLFPGKSIINSFGRQHQSIAQGSIFAAQSRSRWGFHTGHDHCN